MIQQWILGVLALSFWLLAAWMFSQRDEPERINRRLPLFRDQRARRLHPLFRESRDVWSLALVFLGLGVALVIVLIVL